MSELSSSFRDNIQVVERHNVVYVVSLTAKEELWLVSLIGQSSTYEAKLSKLDRQSMFPSASTLSQFEMAWMNKDINLIEGTGRNSSNAELTVDLMAAKPFHIKLSKREKEDEFEFMRDMVLHLAQKGGKQISTDSNERRIRELQHELETTKRELERVRGIVNTSHAPELRGTLVPAKRAAAAKSLVNPRMKMKVAKGTEFGSDTDDEE